MNNFKQDFPIFKINPDLVYLDSASTSQKPQQVIDAIVNHYKNSNANIHRGIYTLSENATKGYEAVREKVRNVLNAKKSSEIVFTNGTTIGLNTLAFGLREFLSEGDDILISEMEHHSNIIPWQRLARENGAHLLFLEIDEEGSLTSRVKDENDQIIYSSIDSVPRLKILSLTHISNVLGTINPIKEIISQAKKTFPEVITIIDAAQSVPHQKVDVQDLNCDFLVFSSHKMFGPTGIGVLYGKMEKLELLEPFIVGSQMIEEVTKSKATYAAIPSRFEPGTMPIEEVVGLGAAIDYLTGIGIETIHRYEEKLLPVMLEKLLRVEGLTLLGPKYTTNRSGVFSFTLEGIHPHDVAQVLSDEGVCVRSGHHCALPLHQKFSIPASTRASLYLYNSESDIEKLVEGIKKVKKIFKV